ncbi:hypothetical protein RRG08_044415 [Elysia crispata]|uniref:Uncharacterized protein n=1 Tax=Elysia crispata TaxID=231223 RepID=A0AAE0ZVZ2_9GAST|nr:hypothetical protein RRG08_044415 [Elysia crispata]
MSRISIPDPPPRSVRRLGQSVLTGTVCESLDRPRKMDLEWRLLDNRVDVWFGRIPCVPGSLQEAVNSGD